MKTHELDYHLPQHLVAQHPTPQRDASRLLIVNRANESITEDTFANLAHYLDPGDCIVLNDTKVIKARLSARKPTGGQLEVFLLKQRDTTATWEALLRPANRVKIGAHIAIENSGQPPVTAQVTEALADGRRILTFDRGDILPVLQQAGAVPLPPYIHRNAPEGLDADRYQTIYAQTPGAVAAPTAGLHFTQEVFNALDAAGIHRTCITLHVGYGTFKPIQTDNLEEHKVDPETFELSPDTALQLNAVRESGHRICAIGTTVTRVLETQCQDRIFNPATGQTNRYIYPPYTFQAIDTLLTNFHLPKSSLLALVYAFAGKDLTLRAYNHAIQNNFRFYSYGDAMLIL